MPKRKSAKRTFTIHDARKTDGCPTKFKNKDYSGVYVSSNPAGAAKKALTQLGRIKNNKGQFSLYLTMRETTQGSKKKLMSYKVTREKLKEPLELKGRVIEFQNKSKSVKSIPKGVGCAKSSGKKRTRKSSRR